MASIGTTLAPAIAEMREFAGFSGREQQFIASRLGASGDAMGCRPARPARDLVTLRRAIGTDPYGRPLSLLIELSVVDLAQEQLASFSA